MVYLGKSLRLISSKAFRCLTVGVKCLNIFDEWGLNVFSCNMANDPYLVAVLRDDYLR